MGCYSKKIPTIPVLRRFCFWRNSLRSFSGSLLLHCAATKIKACTGTCFCKVAGDVGFEPTHAGIKIRCLNQLGESPIILFTNLAGDVGFEPTYVGFRIRCLNQLGESPVQTCCCGRRFRKGENYAFFSARCQACLIFLLFPKMACKGCRSKPGTHQAARFSGSLL